MREILLKPCQLETQLLHTTNEMLYLQYLSMTFSMTYSAKFKNMPCSTQKFCVQHARTVGECMFDRTVSEISSYL